MITFPIGQSGQSLVFSEGVLNHFSRHRQSRWFHRESGGQLFARISQSEILIAEASGPRRSDRRTPWSYVPDRSAAQAEIADRFSRQLHFVGDWHTHPEDCPLPSRTDTASILSCFNRSKHTLNAFLLVIVGRQDFSSGLWVGLCDGQSLIRLVPTSESIQLPAKIDHEIANRSSISPKLDASTSNASRPVDRR